MTLVLEKIEAVQFGTGADSFTSLPTVDNEMLLRLQSLTDNAIMQKSDETLEILAAPFCKDKAKVKAALKAMPPTQLARLQGYLINGSLASDAVDEAYNEVKQKAIDKMSEQALGE